MSALRHGFFGDSRRSDAGTTAAAQAAEFFLVDGERRFWRVLEKALLTERGDAAKGLLAERVQFHAARQSYPAGMGGRLCQLIASLPPATRNRLHFPLITTDACIRLSQYAGPSDYEDVGPLYDAARGKVAFPASTAEAAAPRDSRDQDAAVAGVLSRIGAEALAAIGRPIDAARAAYTLDHVTVESDHEFYEIVASFYLHLLRHSRGLAGPGDTDAAAGRGVALLRRAFADRGGTRGALAEGTGALHGGMRHVLDAMAEQAKREETEDHVRAVLDTALDPMSQDARVAFTQALLRRIGHLLPPDIAEQPVEHLAEHYQVLVRAYVSAADQLAQQFRLL